MTTVIVIIGLCVVVVRRFAGEPVSARDLVAPPLILTGLGVYALTKLGGGLSGAEIGWLVAGSAAGLGMGWMRGRTIRLFTRNGVPHQRYTAWTLGAWVLSLVIGAGIAYLAARSGVRPEARPMVLSVGIGLIGELIPMAGRLIRAQPR